MALTTKHDRQQRLKEQHQERETAKDNEIAKVTARAMKHYGQNEAKRRGVALLMDSPEAQINALDQYITDLRLIGEEMELRYPDVSKQRLWLIDHEINTAVEAISKLRIEQIAPDE